MYLKVGKDGGIFVAVPRNVFIVVVVVILLLVVVILLLLVLIYEYNRRPYRRCRLITENPMND